MNIPPDLHAGAIDIWLLVFPNFMLLDATGPIQVFSTANDEARDAGRAPPYRIHLLAAGGGQVASSSGVSVVCEPLPSAPPPGGTVIVSGGRLADLPALGSAALAGTTPAQLLARLRMEAACRLLEIPGMTVKRAARDSGYGTEYNLRRAFSAQLGILPSEYQARFA